MAAPHILKLYSYVLFICYQFILTSTFTLLPSQSLVDGQTLISQGGTFELGFFSPSSISKNRYVGIWYKKLTVQTVVWVANRDSPLTDKSGVLKIGFTGDLVIVVNQSENVLWSSNSLKAAESPILEFVESGNLVLRDLKDVDSSSYVWQSFDYPGNTLLPGMKLGWNLKTGINRYLSSWRNFDDPSHGDYTYGMELAGYPEFVMRNGSNRYYRGGSWNGVQGTGSPELRPSQKFTYNFFKDAEEIYFMYRLVNHLITWRLVLTQTSSGCGLQRLTWVDRTHSWALEMSEPRDRCDVYKLCGSYSTCDLGDVEVCQCLKGFKPKSPRDWSETEWSQGCEREISLNCSRGEGFRKYTGLKLPETSDSWFNASLSLDECRVKCLNNCSCMGFANSDIRKGGSGCILWFTDMFDMRHYNGAGQDLYVRMAASELAAGIVVSTSASNSRIKEHGTIKASILSVAGALVLAVGGYWMWVKRRLQGCSERDDLELPLYKKRDNLEFYDLDTIKKATNNFSEENKLGEGGFGSVYKGVLDGGEEIAVKRLSKHSIQGIDEFMNELKLISKLQHNNLVRILGCSIQGEEKILVYEYMKNKSLDSFIFDPSKDKFLDWGIRFKIILGVARGLLYLHHDSRLKIIHRDLKTSNVLVDHDMVPKISDFGLARIFGGNQTEARTKRVFGTRGYMAPEYVLDGRFSVKSDVFSFGVMILEIITGKRNRCFSYPGHQLNLLGHAWSLWSEGTPMDLVDESMIHSCSKQDVQRCIHVALLCVQKCMMLRPKMPCVVVMLSSETAVLPKPQLPGFYVERSSPIEEKPCSSDKEGFHSNEATITMLEAR